MLDFFLSLLEDLSIDFLSTLGFNRNGGGKTATVVVGPRSTTLLATSLVRVGPRWRALLDVCNGVGSCGASGALSFGGGR